MKLDIQRSAPAATIDLAEKGQSADGTPISLDRRLFMQLFAFENATRTAPLVDMLANTQFSGVLYEDLNDPTGIALLAFSEDAGYFISTVRQLLHEEPFADLVFKPEYTMFGRTYSLGYEQDLLRTLVTRPVERVTSPDLPWAVWYPVRRSGAFERLSREEQRVILMEHGGIGRAYGEADLAYDIRLASFGLDKNDNDFVIGLLGHELHPLSHLVERMRKTKQTSQYLTNLGPFFIGRAIWQSRGGERNIPAGQP